MVLGVICIPLGAVALYDSLTTSCYRIHHNYGTNSRNNDYYNHRRHYDNNGNEITTTTTTTPVPTTTPYEIVFCEYYGSMFATGIWVGLMVRTV